jgi:hypothetical protein
LLIAIFTEAGKLCIVISWLTVTILSLERVICLYFPNWYTRNANKRNIIACLAVCTIVIVLIKLILRYVILVLLRNEQFDFVKATSATSQNVYFLGIFLAINTVCYIATYLLVKKHARLIRSTVGKGSTSSVSRTFISTKNITCITTVFQLVHIPLLICLLLPFKGEAYRQTYLTMIFMLIMCAVNPILYAWRFKECRYIMFKLLISGCGIFSKREYFNNKVESFRMEVYDINRH